MLLKNEVEPFPTFQQNCHIFFNQNDGTSILPFIGNTLHGLIIYEYIHGATT